MYNGNMNDFINKLSIYMKEYHNRDIHLEGRTYRAKINGVLTDCSDIILYEATANAFYGVAVYDREDFEQQVYNILNTPIMNRDWLAAKSKKK